MNRLNARIRKRSFNHEMEKTMIYGDLYFGDNLDVMRRHLAAESVDLVYLDPPFNSNQNYNVLFKEQDGKQAASQILAFEDTWSWGQDDVAIYEELITQPGKVSGLLQGFYSFLGPCNMMSYLVMMAPRLLELKRVMKSTASIYLHCDPTASHYLKLLMDAVFGAENFRNEIVWKRTPFAGSSKSRASQLPRSHDIILFYSRGNSWIWNAPVQPYSEEYLERFKWDDGDGRGPYRKTLLKTFSQETFERLKSENRLIQPVRPGAKWSYKQYLNESRGVVQIDDVWSDINAINPVAKERLGYPTQKPLALLERIIAASSNEGDVVLDPFCGCGTSIVAAHKMGRRWIGIDITHIAVTLMKNRLKDSFGLEPISRKKASDGYRVIGEPVSVSDAEALASSDKYQFQYWALGLVGARPEKHDEKKGADKGIDGKILFIEEAIGKLQTIILSVKGGAIPAAHVRELLGVVNREKAAMGVLICLHPPSRNMIEDAANAGFYESVTWGRKYPKIQILTIRELLDPDSPKTVQMPPVKATFRKAPKETPSTGGHEQLKML